MKKMLTLLCLFATLAMQADVLVCDKAAEKKATFTQNSYKFAPKIITENDKTFFRVDGRISLLSDATVKVKPDKLYVISVKLRAARNASKALLGVAAYDAQGRLISQTNLLPMPKTFTTLSRPCKKGDTSFFITKGNDWTKGGFTPAFNVKEDASDVPCFTLDNMNNNVKEVKENDDDFEVTMLYPMKNDYPAGTTVRLQRQGAPFSYVVNKAVETEWTEWRSKPTKGESLRKGAATLRPVLICNLGFPKESLDFDELCIEEVSAP